MEGYPKTERKKGGAGNLTRMERHVVVMEEHAEEVGKSRGRTGRESNESSGFSPLWETNSLMWSSVELLLRMASTKCTYTGRKRIPVE